ncbi:MAG: hypothetical protein RLZZ117_2508 [Cyanobacteriota bacterium]|jgi:CYTH domain-containing protein
MALEIERRFLVNNEDWRSDVEWQAEIHQGYLLCRDDGLTIRVRLQRPNIGKASAWMTIKAMPDSPTPCHARLEFEYAIPEEDGRALLRLAPWQVSKTRYGLLCPGGHWVLDVFSGDNAPLILAEVEVDRPEDTPPIPPWCGREVTGMRQLSNAALAQFPWQARSEQERAAIHSLPSPGAA